MFGVLVISWLAAAALVFAAGHLFLASSAASRMAWLLPVVFFTAGLMAGSLLVLCGFPRDSRLSIAAGLCAALAAALILRAQKKPQASEPHHSVAFLRRLSPAYAKALDDGLVGFDIFSQLQPWFLVSDSQIFDAARRWPMENSDQFIVFARRQDRDDLACFRLQNGRLTAIVQVEGWRPDFCRAFASFPSFEAWLDAAREDHAKWRKHGA